MAPDIEDISVTTFRDYLKINTMHPNPNYDEAVGFLRRLAENVGFTFKMVNVAPGNPVVIMTLLGRNPSLPSLFFNSHMDVVPVFKEHWTHDPFGAFKDKNGNIYARGSQDMKCVGIQYVEAIRRLKAKGKTFLRTIHVTFVPDEEVGGALGMKLFVKTEEFKRLNVGFALDEGIASPSETYLIFNTERLKWWLKVTCSGDTGHGSRLIDNTAAEKFQKVVNKFMAFRDENCQKLKNDPSLDLGEVFTVNLTMISGGVQVNVIPSELIANFDIRVPPTKNLEETKIMFEKMALDIDPGIRAEWCQFHASASITNVDEKNIWWKTFSGTLESMKLPFAVKTFVGGTDGRFVREEGIPVLGFSPMVNTPTLLHEHDEYLNEDVYLKGVDIYVHLIEALANLE